MTDYDVIETMARYGGGFVKALSACERDRITAYIRG